jgi:Xaa-Pro aminopeptidase
MYLTILELLSEAGLEDRVTSAEPIVSKLRARKSDYEIACIQQAIDHTLEIYSRVSTFIAPGRSEEDIASFVSQEVEARNLDFAWEESHCPAVFTGPDTAGAHYHPTDRLVLPGHVLNMDFGVKVDGYCSDLQRTFYILEEGQTGAPREVVHGFETIIEAIELSRQALKPGVLGHQVDAVSRSHLKSKGYEEFPHGLGHQVGRFAHDGTALLGPPWEKYANKPFEPIEPGMVFTIEPRLKVPERGTVTVEEMVVVTNEGARFLSEPQTELILIG